MAFTIKDIARESGYAVSTVSRALNNHPDVSQAAKKRVQEIVDAHGFVPNSNAHQLKSQQSKSIMVIVKGTFNPFFATIIEKMQSLISDGGYTSDVHYLEEDSQEVQVAKRLAAESKPQGIVFLGGNAYSFQKEFHSSDKIGLPCVLVTTVMDTVGISNLSCVGVDDTEAFRQSVKVMIGKGHRKFAVLGGNPETSYVSKMRFEGAMLALSENGIEFDASMYMQANFTMESGCRAVRQLLERNGGKADFTCLMCMSDVMAIGALRALADYGIRVNEDVSVVGFDGIEQTEYTIPKLATCRQPQNAIAEESIRKLMDMISGSGDSGNVILPPEMVDGESVRSL